MKVFILLSVIAISQAAVLIGTGSSSQYRSQDGLGNYAFGYNEGHPSGATFRKESGSNGVVAGSYGLTDADGRQRIVNYVADAAGFRADIKTNEPGVEPKDPANAAINKAGLIVSSAAPIAYAAPAPGALPSHVPASRALTYAAAPAQISALTYAAVPAHVPAAPALAYAAAPAAVSVRSGGPFGYSYNTVIGHHGLAPSYLSHFYY